MAKADVPAYIDCGKDKHGIQVVVYFPVINVIKIEPGKNADEETVELALASGRFVNLNAEHSKAFLNITGLRQPETQRVIIPDTASRFPGSNQQ